MSTIDAINVSFQAQRGLAEGIEFPRSLFTLWQNQLSRKHQANQQRLEACKKAKGCSAEIDKCKFFHKN